MDLNLLVSYKLNLFYYYFNINKVYKYFLIKDNIVKELYLALRENILK